jgi:hypothetical protein
MSGSIRLEIRYILKHHQFPKKALSHCETILVRSIRQARIYRKKLPKDYWCEITQQYMPFKKNRRGRNPQEFRIRMLIINSLFRCWRYAFQEEPIINNRGNTARPFTLFVADVLAGENIGNVEDNLEYYRSYIRRLLNIESKHQNVMSTYI